MRIALTHAYCWPEVRRGGERFLHELAAALARHRHDVTVYSAARRPSDTVEEGVRVVRLTRRGEGFAHEATFAGAVLPALLKGGYDVVHSLGPADAAAAMAAGRAGRVARTVYTNLGVPDRLQWRRRRDWPVHLAVARWVDVYGCLSQFAASRFRTDFARQPQVTPGGVRLDRFVPAGERAVEPTLLYSGTLTDPMKNVPLLLEAVALLARRRPAVRLWLTGPGDAGPLLAAAPATAGQRAEVLPVGSPDRDLAAAYGRAWVTVLPSKWESFALTLVESLACGTPVVATTHAAAPERVAPGTGVLCPPDDTEALARACEEALDLATDPGIADRCRAAAAAWDWDRLVPVYERIYCGAEADCG